MLSLSLSVLAKWPLWFSQEGCSAIRSTHSLLLSLLKTTQKQNTAQLNAHSYKTDTIATNPYKRIHLFLCGNNCPYHDQWEQRVMGSFLEPLEDIRVSKDKSWTMSGRLRKYRSIEWCLSSVKALCCDGLSPLTWLLTNELQLCLWHLPDSFLLFSC